MTFSDPSRPNDFFDRIYREASPWDVGEAQPALLALLDDFAPAGPVLDVGCGTGELALALARRSLTVLGVDLAEAAITQARVKTANAAPEVRRLVEFRIGDALRPSQLPGPFRAVVDSGFFHLFGPLDRQRFAGELAETLASGGRYYLLGFAISPSVPNAPRRVLGSELQTLFVPEQGWRILALRPARFLLRLPGRDNIPALAACIERVPPG
ncbi:MAG: class I SAM-dependent methyltransferase [Anaerolineales bacterium]|jgi:SAM-dependent methyltransferase